MLRYVIAITVFAFLLLGGTGLFVSDEHDEERIECLHDADCMQRLEAAINEIYLKAGYPTSTLESMVKVQNH